MKRTIAKALAAVMTLSLLSAPSVVNANGTTYTIKVTNGTANPTTGDEGETTIVTPTVPEGYSFAGWEVTGTGATAKAVTATEAASDTIEVTFGTSDVVATGGLTANTYKVAFNSNGATSGTMESQTLTYDKEEALQANTFVRDGYTFLYWNTKEDGTGTTYADEETVKNLATEGAITLYAQWGHFVVVDNADGSRTITTPTVNADGSLTVLEQTIYSDGSVYEVESIFATSSLNINITAYDAQGVVLRQEKYASNSAVKKSLTIDNYYIKDASTLVNGVDLTLESVTTLLEEYDVPSSITVQGIVYTITKVGNSALLGNETVKTLTVPGTVTVIGKKAFKNMSVLKKATIGKKVKKIKASAFAGNKKMTKVTIKSNKLNTIATKAFNSDKKLKTISFKGKKISTIGKKAFAGIKKTATIKVTATKKKFTKVKKKIKNSKVNKKVKIKRVS